MKNTVQDFVQDHLPPRRKTSPNGWISFNCPHCGDKRGRGGFLFGINGEVTYHCFNCQVKAFYKPGYHLSYSFRKTLQVLGVSDTEVRRLVLEALRVKNMFSPEDIVEVTPQEEIKFEKRPLPDGALTFLAVVEFYTLANKAYPSEFNDAVAYAYDRKINLQDYEFYWTESTPNRLYIPFYWKGEIVGYTARALDDSKPKYINNVDQGFVFNVNKQHPDWKIVIVTEGPFDAMAIDGVALLHNEVSERQAEIIDSLGKEVIVVPDWDKPGEVLIDEAIKYGWNVSFPVWKEQCKDINEAVQKFGKLFVVKTIIDSVERSALKIELKKRL